MNLNDAVINVFPILESFLIQVKSAIFINDTLIVLQHQMRNCSETSAHMSFILFRTSPTNHSKTFPPSTVSALALPRHIRSGCH